MGAHYQRLSTVLDFTLRRMLMEDVPDTQEELCDYCYKLYQHKVSSN